MEAARAQQELEEQLKSQNLLPLVEKYRGEESKQALLGRFLVARNNEVAQAFAFLKADLEWRESVNVKKYQNVTSSQLLAVNGSLAGKAMLDLMLPVTYLGRDKQNRPVMYRKFGAQLDADKLTKKTGFDYEKYFDYNLWCLEMMVKFMGGDGQWVSITVVQRFPVVSERMMLPDCSDLAFRHMTTKHLSWAKVLADLMKDHYPERLGKSLMINCPAIFSMAWAVAKTWLDDRIKAKIGIFGAEKTWKPEMEQIMDLDLLPDFLGGKHKICMDPHSFDHLAMDSDAMPVDDSEAGCAATADCEAN